MSQFEIDYIKHHFPWEEFAYIFFSPDLKDDYLGQRKRVCDWFGLNSIFDYDTIIEGIKMVKSDINTFSKN